VEWSFDGPLLNLWPVIPISNQDGRQAKNRKQGGWNLKKIFSSETTEPISTKLCWNDPWVVPFQSCVRQCRPVSKMAAITKNKMFFKWPKLLYFKPESAQIWTFGREPSNDYFIKILFLLSKWFQTRRFLWEFPIGSYVKLSSAMAAILVGVLKCRTQFWKRTNKESFQQSLVEIGSVVSEKIFFNFIPPFF
jgi:hypothetical protein